MKFTTEKLRQLAKDDSAYEKLLNLFNSFNNNQNGIKLGRIKDRISSNNLDAYFWSREFIDGQKVVNFTDSVVRITGYTVEEIIKKPGRMLAFISEEDISKVKSEMIEFESDPNKGSLVLEYRIIRNDGDIIWVKEFLSVIRDEKGKVLKYNSFVQDITAIKEKESELNKKIELLQEINSQKDRFISIVSHDLRSPFTSLLGFSEILINEPDLPEEMKSEYLGYIYEASQTQLQMINYLLDWSRLQTGRLTIEPCRLSVLNLVNNCVSVLTGNLIKKHIEIKVDVPDNLFINADERLINQSVQNILSNAIKFTPNNKKIFVSANTFKEGLIEITVKDEGIGISEENQEKLFKIDKKLSLVGTNGEKGSGLGLTLVKEIIEKHHGEIWFYSKFGEGSEFHFTMPTAKNTVIVVEENKEAYKKYESIIQEVLPHFEIIQSSTGYEAIRLILHDPPSMIISDHNMSLMNGIQLVEAVRKKEINREIPIIIVSETFNDELLLKYKRLNVNSVIRKPIKEEDLIYHIESSVL
ncbi:MAG: PAS domain-containing protein [Melioribacteraceae bacterium]|nr:PAS domain-containing protein [Melioribacteraceae bacterium]